MSKNKKKTKGKSNSKEKKLEKKVIDEIKSEDTKVEKLKADIAEKKTQNDNNIDEKTITEIEDEGNISILGKRVRIENADELVKEKEVEENHSIRWKIGHFWDYNKSAVIVATIIVVTIILFIRALVIEFRQPQLSIAVINAHMDLPGDVTYGYDFGNETALDPDDGKIVVDTDFKHPYDLANSPLATDDVIASIQRYSAAHTNSYFDVTITTNWVVDEYQKADAFYDLRDIFSEDEIDKISDRLYYSENEAGEKVPASVIINGIRDVDDYYNEGETIVIGIPRYTERLDIAKKFIAWFLWN